MNENSSEDLESEKELEIITLEQDREEEKEGKDLYTTPQLEDALKNSKSYSTDEKVTQEKKEISEMFSDSLDDNAKVHPGFISTYSFGEKDFDRLFAMLMRLDEVSERVSTYRKEGLAYFPEYYSILKNFYNNVKMLIGTNDRKKVENGLNIVGQHVSDFSTDKRLDMRLIYILEEIHGLLLTLKNFHGLGISFEKKRGESEQYYGRFFRKRT